MNKWDKYFHSHYMPKGKNWGLADLLHYKNWYYAWIEYIDNKISFKNSLSHTPHVLEVGSGIGGGASLLKEKGMDVVGSDISREMVKIASKTNNKVKFIYCDIQEKIQGRYDAIFAFEVLEHIPNPNKAIHNIKNSLKKGGYFIGSSPYPYPKAYIDPTHCSVMYPNEWEQLFEKEKFSQVIIYPISFLPFFWRINKRLNIIIPFYLSFPGFVSTALIIAKK